MRCYLFLFLLFAQSLVAQDSLTVDQAIALALEQNFAIRLADNETDIATLNNTRANAGLTPLVTLNAGDNLALVNFQQKLANGTEIRRPLGVNNAFTASVNASWTLYNGGRFYLEKSRLEALDQLAKDQLRAQIRQTTASVAIAWLAVARSSETIRNLEEVIAAVQERLSLADARLSYGLGNKADVLQAQIDLNQRKRERTLAENARQEAKRQLNSLLGRNPETPFITTRIPALPVLPDTAALRVQLLNDNTTLDVLERSLKIAQIAEQQARTLGKPVVGITGAYNFLRSDNNAGFFLFNMQHGPTAGINFSMPLYTGGNLRRQAEVAKAGVVGAGLQIEQMQLVLLQQMYNLAGRYQALQSTLSLANENLQFARENQLIALERFRQGQTTALEIREAQLTLENALFQVNQTVFDLLGTDAQLKALF